MNRNVGSTYKKEKCDRKNNKQIMEKRRRARINSCLAELKHLVLKGLQKEESDFTKLEKADILEMTVTYMNNTRNEIQCQKFCGEDDQARYRAGFNECAKAAFKYIGTSNHVQNDTRMRLMEHLAEHLQLKREIGASSSKTDNSFVLPVPRLKRQMHSPAPDVPINMAAYPVLDTKISHTGRSSPQTADTFPTVIGHVDIQSLSLKDKQSTASSHDPTQKTESADILKSSLSTEKALTDLGQTNDHLGGSDSVWRPW